ncbi:MAG: class I SAM-dependent methyltransferase [Anaerolineales bacterium]|jgi:methyltransferase (TIGR00027 family)
MKNKQRYSTAETTAAIRAMHLLYDQPVVFNDPYALQLTSPALRRICQSRFFQWILGRKFIAETYRPIAGQVLSRAKYVEEKLEQAVSDGISQYILIGAGFDSFCLRRPDFSSDLMIFEVDHPATQRIKRQRLKEVSDSSLGGVEFIAVDLEKRTISDALSDSSFSKDEKAFFSWLGTIPYLSEDAVFAVLRDLADFAARDSEIVFDYLIPTSKMTHEDHQALRKGMRIIERWGEPVRSYFNPDSFPDDVSHLGYQIFENRSPDKLNKRYFSNRSDNLVAHLAAYIVHAAIIRD